MDVNKLNKKLKSRDKRHCSQCGRMLKYVEFGYVQYSPGKFKFRSPCKSCQNKNQKNNPKRFDYRYKKYGITSRVYQDMYNSQGGKCAICGEYHNILSIDHNHVTGKIRKLLCSKCNTAIGYFNENPQTIKRAADYLESFPE